MKKLLLKAPITTASGYGVHSRQILKGLLASGVYDVSIRPLTWGNTSMLNDDSPLMDTINKLCSKHEHEQQQGVQYDVSVQVTIPNEFEKLAKINVGITAGIEVDIASPEWLVRANNMVDVLFVPSVHSKKVFEMTSFQDDKGNTLKLNKPAHLAHEGFDPRYYNTNRDTHSGRSFEFDTDFNFLFVGLGINDRLGEGRKNIANLVKWFCEAFRDNKEVGLVLKTALVNNSLLDFEMTKKCIKKLKMMAGCGEYPKVHLVHGRLTDEEMAGLYKNPQIKAFCTLTHGEGFGLPLLEAAACGLPIMAPAWSGHMDFLTVPDVKRSFVELDHEMTRVPDGDLWKGVIEQGSHWASAKEDDFKLKLRRVHGHYDRPKEWAMGLAKHVHENFTEGRVMSALVEDIIRFSEQAALENPQTPEELIRHVKSKFDEHDAGKKLLYTMPMSAGDVYISTAVIDGLRRKHPDHKIFFATKDQYMSIVQGNPNVHRCIRYEDWMTNVPLLERMFDEVYTPNLNVQMTFSNWVRGGKGRLLANEMANACNVELGEYHIETKETSQALPEKYIVFNPGSGKGQWEARSYLHWQEVINNLKRELDIPIVQMGMSDDPLYDGCLDFRGETKDFQELAYLIKGAELVLGIDSVSMHMAAGFGIDHVALFGSSYPSSTGPVIPVGKKCKSVLLETEDRYGCDKACYKYQCERNREHPCINEIDPRDVYLEVLRIVLGGSPSDGSRYAENYQEYSPKISGYTHVLNAESGGYPYVQSIKSMLGFCDEVIVVDGGSDDGTRERIEAIGDDRIQIHDRKWDWGEPGMDGMQKAYGRAMCSGEFLWQQDVDEVVHERDYEKVKKLAKMFPKQVDLVHLPVVELWGDAKHARASRHSWKWRMSRNNFRITHGIVKHARVMCEKTGKVYAKRGMCDGCSYIDIMTQEYIPHGGFWNGQFQQLMQTNPQEYGKVMNKVFAELPSVWHFSWCDLPRKVKNFKQTWDKLWTGLYLNQEPEDRFPTVKDENDEEGIARVAEELRLQGDEHGKGELFQLELEPPKVMEEWLKSET